MNIELQIYIIINQIIMLKIYDILNIKFLFIFKSQLIRRFNDELNKKLITYIIYSYLTINDYMK